MNHALIDADEIVLRAEGRVGLELEEKWTLQRVLGLGGMAAVYAAQHRNQSRVAIKMLHAHFSADRVIRERFLAEGYAGNSIDHRGVVRILDDGLAPDGSAFVVMDLLEGMSLEQLLLCQTRLSPAHAIDFAIQASEILHAAHLKGVVHRDIKPDNFFITTDGEVKLLDFGIARISQKSRSTTVGSFMGTPAYASPEQAKGKWESVDWQSDLWSLAATLFTVLTGQQVHEGETSMEQLAKAVSHRPRTIESTGIELPDDLCALINQALRPEKELRFSNISAWLKGLYSIEARLPLPERDLGELCLAAAEAGGLAAAEAGAIAEGIDDASYARRATERGDSPSQVGGAPTAAGQDVSQSRRSLRPPSTGRRRRSRGARRSIASDQTEAMGTVTSTQKLSTEYQVQASDRTPPSGPDEGSRSVRFPWLVAGVTAAIAAAALALLLSRAPNSGEQTSETDAKVDTDSKIDVDAKVDTEAKIVKPPLINPTFSPDEASPSEAPAAEKTEELAQTEQKPSTVAAETQPVGAAPSPKFTKTAKTSSPQASAPRTKTVPSPTPSAPAPHPEPAPSSRELMLKGRY